MKKIEDFEHSYEGFWPTSQGKCRIRIFSDEHGKLVGICTALPDNYGTSTTNRIEYIYVDIKEKFLKKVQGNDLTDNATISSIEKFIGDNKTAKSWAVAGSLLLKGWNYFRKINESKKDSEEEQQLTWIDHWPKGTGFRPCEHEFAVVKFSQENEPFWIHMNEQEFEKHIGIDIRLLDPLELVEVKG